PAAASAIHVTAPESLVRATSSVPRDKSPHCAGVKRYRRPLASSSVMYNACPTGSAAIPACVNVPSAARATAASPPSGLHSQTRPRGTASHESQVRHGVTPPPELREVPEQIAYASVIVPLTSKRIAP